MTVPDLRYRVQNPKAASLGLLLSWVEAVLDAIWPTLPVNKQQGQIPLISYRLLFAAMKSHWDLGDLNAIQRWHIGAQQKYNSGQPKWKRAFSLVRKWQRITSQEVPGADLQGSRISLTLTPVPGPKATTADENTETSLWSNSKSDWQKAAGRMSVCHFESMVQQKGFHHKRAFLLPLHMLWHRGHKMPYGAASIWEEQLINTWFSWDELRRNSSNE